MKNALLCIVVGGETGHWTLKCPKRSQIQPFASSSPPPAEESNKSSSGAAPAPAGQNESSGKYVPMHLRNAEKRGVSSLRDSEGRLRVTNLSEDVTESDLADLFRRFGTTTRIYLAKDHQTGLSRGFAFVNFASREAAQAAIDKLDGHGYDNLILHVEWAKAKEERETERE
jgi:translation initiation factor 3 subunit G